MQNSYAFYCMPSGNVFAVLLVNGRLITRNAGKFRTFIGVGPIYDTPNSQVEEQSEFSRVVYRWRQISEKQARELHPALFLVLDKEN
jgi:hypothetical protein